MRGKLRGASGGLLTLGICGDRENSHRNSYIEETVLCAVNGIAGLDDFKRKDTFRQLAESKIGVHVTLRGDNDFYSQVQRVGIIELKTLDCLGLVGLLGLLERVKINLLTTEHYTPERGGKLVALKTGMGSSAALVTSLVAALVAFFVPSVDFDKREEDLELVHNLAQLSHCYVQRKIGSGFDVSAACFGSQRYTRFPASILSTFTSENALKPEEIADCITNRALWSTITRVKPVQLPSSFHLMMGDVSSGSATVSMVRQVLKWQSEQPDHAQKVMNELHGCNMEVEQGFAELCKLENSHGTPIQWELFAKQSCDQLVVTHQLIIEAPCSEMGTSAGVPIEPPEQTAILDAAQAIPGVLVAGVPGGNFTLLFEVGLQTLLTNGTVPLYSGWIRRDLCSGASRVRSSSS
ncbi:unnamed protein product [Phytophthora lilii]|uniref:phosphomevalonate kinase n=1 Tax=Phytophthora lilii TaxID=2077276 RepID=A0A9W6WNS0_9STRA|nr:unnamed protein product [Phytophthora lilii]